MVNMFFNDGTDWINSPVTAYPIDLFSACGDVLPKKTWVVM